MRHMLHQMCMPRTSPASDTIEISMGTIEIFLHAARRPEDW